MLCSCNTVEDLVERKLLAGAPVKSVYAIVDRFVENNDDIILTTRGQQVYTLHKRNDWKKAFYKMQHNHYVVRLDFIEDETNSVQKVVFTQLTRHSILLNRSFRLKNNEYEKSLRNFEVYCV